MKVSPQDLDRLTFAIAPLDTTKARNAMRELAESGKARVSCVDKFYRWYLYNTAFDAGFRFEGNYNDAHIDTALRRVVVSLDEY